MKSLKRLAVILLAGIVVASALLGTAEAGPGKAKPVKLKISCTAPDIVGIDNIAGSVIPSTCLVNGAATYSFPPNSDLDIEVASTVAANPVTLNLDDGTGNNKYKVKGDGNSVFTLSYADNTGDDNLHVMGDGNDKMIVDDNNAGTGAGNDDYKGKDISSFTFTDSLTPDMDKIHIN